MPIVIDNDLTSIVTLGAGGPSIPANALAAYGYRSPWLAADNRTLLDQTSNGTARDVQPGRALDFDGTTQYLEAANYSPGTAALSVSVCFRTTATGNDYLASFGSDLGTAQAFRLSIESGVIWERSTGCAASWGSAINDGNWHHVVLTKTANGNIEDFVCYIDGVLVARSSVLGSRQTLDISGADNTCVGSDFGAGLFEGKIFPPEIFTRVVTQTEITAMATQHRELLADYPTDAVIRLDTNGRNSGSLGSAYDATLVNGPTVYEGNDVPFSWANLRGYSDGVNLLDDAEAAVNIGWAASGATAENLSLDVLGMFRGVRVTSQGVNWHRLNHAETQSAINGQTWTLTAYYQLGTSGRVRIVIRNNGGANESRMIGVPGSLVADNASAGPIAVLSEELLADGLTRKVVIQQTPNYDGSTSIGIGPDSNTSGETVIALGAQLQSGLNSTDLQLSAGTPTAGQIIPLKANDPTQDVFGNPADYTGRVPRIALASGDLSNDPALLPTGSAVTIDFTPEPDAPYTRGLTLPRAYGVGDGSSGDLVVGSSTPDGDSQFSIQD